MKNVLRITGVALTLGMLSAEVSATTIKSLPSLNALPNQTSISGLSSGAFMSAQFHIAYSESLVGAGIVAGGPWNCAQTNPAFTLMPVYSAVSSCMNPCDPMPPFNNAAVTGVSCPAGEPKYPDPEYLYTLATSSEAVGLIDSLENVADDKIYLFSGHSDQTVQTGVVDSAVAFYRQLGVDESQIFYNASVDAGHAFITNNPADTQCDETAPPFINNCELTQAYNILNQIYGGMAPPVSEPEGELIAFNQGEFVNSLFYPNVSMDSTAYVYVPKACAEGTQCKVHVAMHGCEQGAETLQTEYITDTGYNNVADANDLIVLYPQAVKSILNPKGCWDFWGYSNNNLPPFNYFTKSAPQMVAIKGMIDRLTTAP